MRGKVRLGEGGRIEMNGKPFNPEKIGMETCFLCRGAGRIDKRVCVMCGGFGFLIKKESLFKELMMNWSRPKMVS